MASADDDLMPKVAIFDLDDTLWPWDVDGYQYRFPYKSSGGKVVDSRGSVMDPFPHANKVLLQLHSKGVKLGAASRTTFPEGANSLINLYGWNKLMDFRQIYPGSKVSHFKQIKKQSKVEYEDMMFFDNEHRNIRDVSQLGVTCILVDSYKGVTLQDLEKGLKKFRETKTNSSNSSSKRISSDDE